jgi:hypothetical protein
MDITTIKPLYKNAKTFACVKSLVKKVNTLMGLEPIYELHYQHYVKNFELLCNRLITSSTAHTKDQLLSQLNNLVGAFSRMKHDQTEFRQKIIELKLDATANIPNTPPPFDARPWSEIKAIFRYEMLNNPNHFARIIACIYFHGYVLRCNEIFNTTTKDLTPKSAPNFLDLTNHVWVIREHKTKDSAGNRTFNVSPEFVQDIKQIITMPDWLLIYKTNYSQYSNGSLKTVNLSSVSNMEARNSAEEFNWKQSNRTLAEKRYYSENVLGHSEICAKKYYTCHSIAERIMSINDPAPEFLTDTTHKIASSGKIRVKIKRKLH